MAATAEAAAGATATGNARTGKTGTGTTAATAAAATVHPPHTQLGVYMEMLSDPLLPPEEDQPRCSVKCTLSLVNQAAPENSRTISLMRVCQAGEGWGTKCLVTLEQLRFFLFQDSLMFGVHLEDALTTLATDIAAVRTVYTASRPQRFMGAAWQLMYRVSDDGSMSAFLAVEDPPNRVHEFSVPVMHRAEVDIGMSLSGRGQTIFYMQMNGAATQDMPFIGFPDATPLSRLDLRGDNGAEPEPYVLKATIRDAKVSWLLAPVPQSICGLTVYVRHVVQVPHLIICGPARIAEGWRLTALVDWAVIPSPPTSPFHLSANPKLLEPLQSTSARQQPRSPNSNNNSNHNNNYYYDSHNNRSPHIATVKWLQQSSMEAIRSSQHWER
eukprot:m.157552 g.157552  ORF g.157552 m.157552 type:complete len:384 (+) comp17006_c1_seq5:930-2081(+)